MASIHAVGLRDGVPEAAASEPSDAVTAGRSTAAERRRTFLLVRYVLIIAVGALVILRQPAPLPLGQALLILALLASNVALGRINAAQFFQWWVQGPVLIVDTVWISTMLISARLGQEFFLFYFIELFLAAISERLGLLAVGAVLIGIASVVLSSDAGVTAESLIRLPFFFATAIFYGYVVDTAKQERRLAAEGAQWATRLEDEVRLRTRELERQSAELRALYDQVLEANRLKSEFVANVSHELRTPLNAVLGYADLLITGAFGELSAGVVEACSRIQHRATALHRLLENLLEFAKLDAEQQPVCADDVRLAPIVEQALSNACQASPPRVAFAVQLPPHLPVIQTDAQKLRAILEQLLLNAITFTPAGGQITVAVEDRAAEERVGFSVRDSGVGIDPADAERIFEDFRQLDGTTTRAYGGVGLGLALVRRYLRLLDGEITVASAPGRGSSFNFTLPYRLAANGRQPPPLRAAANA